MSDGAGWGVYERGGDVHVAPSLGQHAFLPAAGHVLARDCWCRPEVIRDGPLDEPVWSHREAGWPGEKPMVLQ